MGEKLSTEVLEALTHERPKKQIDQVWTISRDGRVGVRIGKEEVWLDVPAAESLSIELWDRAREAQRVSHWKEKAKGKKRK
jgi:hypothetical protein